MTTKYEPLECWALAWDHGIGPTIIVPIVARTKTELMAAAGQRLGMSWDQIRKRDGLAVKVRVEVI